MLKDNPARAAFLEVITKAFLAGHDLGGFEPVEGITPRYQAYAGDAVKSPWWAKLG